MPDVDTSTASPIDQTTAGMPNPGAASDVLAGIDPATLFPYPGDNPNAPAPAGTTLTAAPQPPITPAPQMDPIPQETQQHMGGIHRALNAVANLLGGPITYRLEPAKDGSLKIAPEPSTTGEKWGRVAANALGGFVAGAANAGGPGGLEKAAAAGAQFGLQQPQKQRQQQEQQVDFQNKQLLAQANRMHLTQQMYAEAQKQRLTGMLLDDESANRLKEYTDLKSKHSGFTDFGVIDPKDPNATSKFDKEHPGALDAFLGKGDKTLLPIPEPDGKVHLVGYDKALDDQKTTEAEETPYIAYKPDTNEPYIATKTVDAGTHTRGELANNSLAVHKELIAQRNTWATTQKNLGKVDKPVTEPKTWQDAFSQASATTDPAEKKRLTDLGNDLYHKQVGLKETAPAVPGQYTPPPAGSPASGQVQTTTKNGEPVIGAKQGWGGGDPSSTFEKTARGVYDGDILYTRLPPRGLKGQPTKNDYYARAKQIADDEGQPFSEEQIQGEAKYFEDTKVQPAFTAMDRLVGPINNPHDTANPSLLDQIAIQAKRAGVTSPQATINDITQGLVRKFGQGRGQAEADALLTDLQDLRTNLATVMGTPGLTGGLTDQKLKEWTNAYVPDMTLGSIAATNREIRTAIGTERNAAFRTNRYLRNKYGQRTAAPQQPQQGGRVTGYGPQGYGSYPAGTTVSQTPPTS